MLDGSTVALLSAAHCCTVALPLGTLRNTVALLRSAGVHCAATDLLELHLQRIVIEALGDVAKGMRHIHTNNIIHGDLKYEQV
jgi:hypothetical protein